MRDDDSVDISRAGPGDIVMVFLDDERYCFEPAPGTICGTLRLVDHGRLLQKVVLDKAFNYLNALEQRGEKFAVAAWAASIDYRYTTTTKMTPRLTKQLLGGALYFDPTLRVDWMLTVALPLIPIRWASTKDYQPWCQLNAPITDIRFSTRDALDL